MGGIIRRETLGSAPPFSFQDVEHQAREIIARAERQAAQILAEAQARANQAAEACRRQAYARGLAEGRQAGREQIEKEARAAAVAAASDELARLAQALAAGLAEYERNKHRLIALAESGLIELALAIARRVCKTAVVTSVEPACANVRALLELVKHQRDVELRLHPADYDLLLQAVPQLAQQVAHLEHVSIKADPAVPRGGCWLRTQDGTIDASIDTQLQRVADALCGCPPSMSLDLAAASSDATLPQAERATVDAQDAGRSAGAES